MRAFFWLLTVAVVATTVYVVGVLLGWYGVLYGPGAITRKTIPAEVVARRAAAKAEAAQAIGAGDKSSCSATPRSHHLLDEFLWTLPVMGGEGAHPMADDCDIARSARRRIWRSRHAEAITRASGATPKRPSRMQCRSGTAGDPDVIAFLGWEWTQVGKPATKLRHRRVLRHL